MPRNGKTFGKLAAVVVTLTFCLVASPARAERDGWFSNGEVLGITLVVSAALVIPSQGMVVAFGNLYYGIKGERAPSGWRAQGWVFGGLNIALGATVLGIGLSSPDKDNFGPQLSLLFFAVGAMDIGFTIWSSIPPERKSRLTVNPIVLQAIEGNPAGGIGLNLGPW